MNENTAEWVWDPDGIDWYIGAWACNACWCLNHNLDACKKDENPMIWSGSKYCPNCGRKMSYHPEGDNYGKNICFS